MAEIIDNIMVVIGMDATSLSAALTEVSNRTKEAKSELEQVEQLLKLDPSNVELLTQKQKLLGESVESTKIELELLKSVQQQVADQLANGNINAEQYRAFQREIVKVEQELGNLEQQLSSSSPSMDAFGAKAKEAGNNLKSAGESISGAGEALSGGITGPLTNLAKMATDGTKELREDMSKLETNALAAGASLDITKSALRDLNAITGDTESGVAALSSMLNAGFTDNQMGQALDVLSGAIIKFPDGANIEGLADGLRETMATGAAAGPFAELLELMGLNLDEFNAGLTEANKNGTEQQYVLDTLAKTGLAEVNKMYRENNQVLLESANAQYDLQQSLSELGNLLEPIITAITEKISELLNWFTGLDSGMQTVIITIATIAAAIGPLLIIIGQVVTAIGTITGAMTAVGGVMAIVTGPIGITIAAIAALAAAAYLIVENWEPIKEFFSNLWDGILATLQTVIGFVQENWQSLLLLLANPIAGALKLLYDLNPQFKEWVNEIWDSIVDTLKNLPDTITGFFKDVYNGIKQWGVDTIDWIKTEVPTFISTIYDFFNELPGKIGFAIGEALGKMVLWGADVINWIETEVPKFISNIVGFFMQLPGKIWTELTNAYNKVSQWGANIINWIATEVPKFISNITGFFAQLPGKVWTELTNAYNKVKQWGTDIANWIQTEVPKFVSSIVGFFAQLPNDMLNIGKDIVSGLWNGINSMGSWVKDKISDFSNGVVGGFKSALSINSPSRRMRDEVGMSIGEGLALGMEKSAGYVEAAVSDLNEKIFVNPISANFGPPQATTNQYNLSGLFAGANFSVRNDSDITAIARAVAAVIGGDVSHLSRGMA